MAVKKDTKTGKWYYYGKYTDVFGKTVQYKKRGFNGSRAARKAESEFILLSKKEKKTEYTFNELVVSFLDYKKYRTKPRTLYDYKHIIKSQFSDFDNKKLKNINVNVIQAWQHNLMDKKYSNSTALSNQKLLSSIFRFAVKNEMMSINPFDKIDYVKNMNEPVKELSFFTYDQYIKFRSVIDNDYYRLVFDTLYFTGMRLGELQARKWSDINWTDEYIVIKSNYDSRNKTITHSSKTGELRIVYLNKSLIVSLKQLQIELKKQDTYTNNSYIFGITKPIPQNSIANNKRKFIELYNNTHDDKLPMIRLHDFRHSHVSLLINNGIDSFTISERLGHSKEMVEKVYGHMFPENKKKVIDMLNNL